MQEHYLVSKVCHYDPGMVISKTRLAAAKAVTETRPKID